MTSDNNTTEWKDGYKAALRDYEMEADVLSACPYLEGDPKYELWMQGYDSFMRDNEECYDWI